MAGLPVEVDVSGLHSTIERPVALALIAGPGAGGVMPTARAGAEVRLWEPLRPPGSDLRLSRCPLHYGHGLDFVDLRPGRALGPPGATVWEHQVATAGLARAVVPAAKGEQPWGLRNATAGRPVLLDEEGVEVLRGDPLCIGSLTYCYGCLEPFDPCGELAGDLCVTLLARSDAAAWKRCVRPGDPELYRGPSVADEADARLYGQRVPLPGVTYQ